MSYPLKLINDFPPGEFGKRYCLKCDAHCCRRGVYVPLRKGELVKMIALAHELQRDVGLSLHRFLKEPTEIPFEELETHDRMLWVMSYSMSEPCGFLDLETNRCIIYEDRPLFCREFYCPGGYGGLGGPIWRPTKAFLKRVFPQQ